jgi:hypothetical protein
LLVALFQLAVDDNQLLTSLNALENHRQEAADRLEHGFR